MTPPTVYVSFRTFPPDEFGRRDVIALFPFRRWNNDPREISSYMRVGQHSAADKCLLDDFRHATPDEYADLLRELRGIYEHKMSAYDTVYRLEVYDTNPAALPAAA